MPGFNLSLLRQGTNPQKFGGPPNTLTGGPTHPPEVARTYRFMIPYFLPLEFTANQNNNRRNTAHPSNDGLQFYVKSIQRPGIEFDNITIHSGQDEIYRPGKVRSTPIEIVFYEVIGHGTDLIGQAFYAWWSRRVIDVSTSRGRRPGVWNNQDEFAGYYFNAQVDMLNGYGDAVWSYLLYDCWPEKISPAQLSYDSSELAEYSVTLRYNKLVEFGA